ncbi:hypothetical protein [Pelomonas sp. SE-A7]|uniref:hypothetical protein n=1 Tax=Pelomonas sp. SE-A7 TaxID=3054953 RepID=UPI00259C85C5|nr:hypothetical protein [Pelomonas sp. SE-A7]MDM4767103.1 hypothetical protein [Pelomonas sp. SE-A7]
MPCLSADPADLARRRACAMGLLALVGGVRAAPAAGQVAVLYPEVAEPYRSVFARILDGIDDKVQAPVGRLAVPAQGDGAGLLKPLLEKSPKVVIALGRAGLRLAEALDRSIEVVGGGVVGPPEGEQRSATLLSLNPDPALLLQRLRSLQSTARRVTLVHSIRSSGWLLRFAREAARQQELELRAVEVDDLKGALRQYQDFFANAQPRDDALWLPQDAASVDEAAVLPYVLQEAWDRNIVVFSSSLAHVRRGVLFSLYPDNLELGRHLATLALGYLGQASAAPRGAQPLKAVQAALNWRTAQHLSLNLNAKQMRSFELLLPEK